MPTAHRRAMAFDYGTRQIGVAVGQTLTGLREAYPDRRLWAVFEPASSTNAGSILLPCCRPMMPCRSSQGDQIALSCCTE